MRTIAARALTATVLRARLDDGLGAGGCGRPSGHDLPGQRHRPGRSRPGRRRQDHVRRRRRGTVHEPRAGRPALVLLGPVRGGRLPGLARIRARNHRARVRERRGTRTRPATPRFRRSCPRSIRPATRTASTYDGPRPYTMPRSARSPTSRRLLPPRPAGARPSTGQRSSATADFGIGLFKPDLVRFTGIPGTPRRRVQRLGERLPDSFDERGHRRESGVRLRLHTRRRVATPDPLLRVRPPAGRAADYQFRFDRRHSWYTGRDRPRVAYAGALRVLAARPIRDLEGPEAWWRARSVPIVYVRARWMSSTSQVAALRWVSRVRLLAAARALVPVSRRRFDTDSVPLAGVPGYTGWITGLELEPLSSTRRRRGRRRVHLVAALRRRQEGEAASAASGPVPYLDSLRRHRIDQSFWQEVHGGSGPSVDPDERRARDRRAGDVRASRRTRRQCGRALPAVAPCTAISMRRSTTGSSTGRR